LLLPPSLARIPHEIARVLKEYEKNPRDFSKCSERIREESRGFFEIRTIRKCDREGEVAPLMITEGVRRRRVCPE
jgi:hypothetical protein